MPVLSDKAGARATSRRISLVLETGPESPGWVEGFRE